MLREEKDVLAEQVVTFQHQVESQNLVVRKLEEKERILLSNLAAIEKELAWVLYHVIPSLIRLNTSICASDMYGCCWPL